MSNTVGKACCIGKAYYIEGTPDWGSLQVNVRIEPDEMGRLDFVRVSNRTQWHERDIVFVPKTRLEAYERAMASRLNESRWTAATAKSLFFRHANVETGFADWQAIADELNKRL